MAERSSVVRERRGGVEAILKNIKMNKKIFLTLILILALLVNFSSVLADNDETEEAETEEETTATADEETSQLTDEEIDQEIQEQEEELQEIDKKIQKYEKKIEEKQKQKKTLSNQIEILEQEIDNTKNKIEKSKQELKLTKLEIESLKTEIEQKDEEIEKNNEILSELIRESFHSKNETVLQLLLKYDNVSQYFSEVEKINKINAEIKKILEKIKSDRAIMQENKVKLEEKRYKIEEIKEESEKNKIYLEANQDSKEDLLVQTKGEEEKYQDLLAKIEEQRNMILGNLDEMMSLKSSEIAAIELTMDKPKKGLASTSWYFSQRDSRWGSDNIGMSNTKMAEYGCAVTSVSMVFRYHGLRINPGYLAKQKIFYYDLIMWPNYWQGIRKVGSSVHGNIDWDEIDEQIKKDNPVIIFVGAKGKGAGHYVVIHNKDNKGRYIVHDPYWGPNLFLDSTRKLIATLYGSSTYIDQMIIYNRASDIEED
jgi:peptidoglycan hydrolase CwlO-like protein